MFCFLLLILQHTVLSYSVTSPRVIDLSYEELFGGLSDKVTTQFIPWLNGVTIEGWWSNVGEYTVSDGTNSYGRGLCSLGYNNAPSRSLGAIPYDHAKIITFGVSIISDMDIQEITIEYMTEQWRFGGTNHSMSYITCEIGVFEKIWYENDGFGALLNRGWPWNEIKELQINSLVDEGKIPIPLDGKNPSNRYKVSKSIPINWPRDNILQIRWIATKSVGSFNYLGLSHLELWVTPKPNSIDLYKTLFFAILAVIIIMSIFVCGVYWYRKKYQSNIPKEGSLYIDETPEPLLSTSLPEVTPPAPPLMMLFNAVRQGELSYSDVYGEKHLRESEETELEEKNPHEHDYRCNCGDKMKNKDHYHSSVLITAAGFGTVILTTDIVPYISSSGV